MCIHALAIRWIGLPALLLGIAVYARAHEQRHTTDAHEAPIAIGTDQSADADGGHRHEVGTVHTAGEADADAGLPHWTVVTGRFHPLIVHLPIGLLSAAALLHLTNLWFKSPAVAGFVRVGLFAGAIVAVAAAGLGWLNAATAEHGDAALVETHRWRGIALACAAVTAAVISEAAVRAKERARLWRVALVLAAASLLVLVVLAGHSGGALVYGADYPFGP